jgi:signal recognition particle receptor subunit beta
MAAQVFWIVVTGMRGSGQTTFVNTASEHSAYRDRRDMSVIPAQELQRTRTLMAQWTARFLATGEDGTPDERAQVDRYQNSLLVGELSVTPELFVCLYEAPPANRYDGAWETIGDALLGIVVLVDSTAPETFRESAQIIGTVADSGTPYLVAANKQDHPDATTPNDLAVLCGATDAVTMGCVAHDLASVKAVLLALLDNIRDG